MNLVQCFHKFLRFSGFSRNINCAEEILNMSKIPRSLSRSGNCYLVYRITSKFHVNGQRIFRRTTARACSRLIKQKRVTRWQLGHDADVLPNLISLFFSPSAKIRSFPCGNEAALKIRKGLNKLFLVDFTSISYCSSYAGIS